MILQKLLGVELPIVQAPGAKRSGGKIVIAGSNRERLNEDRYLLL